MSYYKNMISDFPGRIQDLINRSEELKFDKEREVTFLICMASAGINIPWERIQEKHFAKNNFEYSEVLKTFKESVLVKEFKEVFQDFDERIFYLKSTIEIFDKDSIYFNDDYESIQDKNTNEMISIFRNALAHGNIFTFHDPIKEILFVSLKTDFDTGKFKCYKILKMEISVFKEFLVLWLTKVGEIIKELEDNTIIKGYDDAA